MISDQEDLKNESWPQNAGQVHQQWYELSCWPNECLDSVSPHPVLASSTEQDAIGPSHPSVIVSLVFLAASWSETNKP